MKHLLLLAFFAVSTAAAAQTKPSLRALEEKNGFRDVQLGSDSSALAGRVLQTHAGNSYTYARAADSPQIGGATAAGISYTYYKGRLSTVTVLAEGAANAAALKDALEAQYSWGIPENAYSKTYYWQTKRVKMVYQIDPVTDKGALFVFSREVLAQKAQDEKATAGKASL